MPREKPPCANSFSKRSETLLFEVQLQMSSFVVTTRFNNQAVVGLFPYTMRGQAGTGVHSNLMGYSAGMCAPLFWGTR